MTVRYCFFEAAALGPNPMGNSNHHPNEAARAAPAFCVSGALEAAPLPEAPPLPSAEDMWRTLHDLKVHQAGLEMQNEELRRVQAELDATRERYFDLYNLAPVGYLTLSGRAMILEANLAAADMLGTARDLLPKRPFSRFVFNEDQDLHHLHCNKLFETGQPQVCELRLVKPDETYFWARLEASSVHGKEGQPEFRVVISDINAKKQAEQILRDRGVSLEQQVAERTANLKRSEDRFRLLSESAFEGVAVSENGILLDGDLCFADLHGYRLEEMIGRPVADFVAPESRALVARRCNDDFRDAYEFFALRKDGSVFPAEAHGRNKVWQGRTTRMTALRDLTLAKQAEAELQARQSELEHAQQLALVSEISAGIVHQLAQPLSAMGANVFSAISTLDKRVLSTAEMLEVLTDLQDGVTNMRDIVIHLRALTNPQKSDRVAMDINAILQKVLPLVRAKAASHRARIELDLVSDLPPVQADLVQLGQVILNLSRNALEACDNCPPERRIVSISTREIPDEGVELCVRDAGTGIAPEVMERLFGPFFSTKPDGLGVGLRLSQTIVRSHCGRITAENNAGGVGAAFRIILPATSGDKG